MTLDKLKKKYKELSEACASLGNLYEAEGDKERAQGNFENAKIFYSSAAKEFKEATIYRQFVNDLNKVTK